MRGKHGAISDTPSTRRITPAGAGKTGVLLPHVIAAEDHPRRCGENCTVSNGWEWKTGSPPQVRGKRLFSYLRSPRLGITPAGAGKTTVKASAMRIKQDHPRRCGENWCFAFRTSFAVGSPPQVRGKLKTVRDLGAAGGITPAGAGKTPSHGVSARG